MRTRFLAFDLASYKFPATGPVIGAQQPEFRDLNETYVRAGESYTVPAGIAYRLIDAR